MTITHKHKGFFSDLNHTFIGVINDFKKDELKIITVAVNYDLNCDKENIHRIDRTIITVGQWKIKNKIQ